MSSFGSPSPRRSFRRRLKKGAARSMAPVELKRILVKSLRYGHANEALEDIIHAPLPNRVTLSHWHLDEDAWHIPAPNAGARELCFAAFMGNVSKASVMRHICGDRDCVNPFHVNIMTRSEAKARDNGTWERRIVAPDMTIQKQSTFEASLTDPIVLERQRKAARDAAKARALSLGS